jgi:hypothetical protein
MPVGPGATYMTRGPAVNTDAGLGLGVQAGAELSVTRDGTPSRVAGIVLLAGGVLAILRLSGFRFNVGVSS